MQTSESLSYEAIPSRFCEAGDHAAISTLPGDDFSFRHGFSVAFSSQGTFIRRQHVNAIGRIGTSAQALLQAGEVIGHVEGVAYGEKAAVTLFDGTALVTWVSASDGNTTVPLCGTEAVPFSITDTTEVSDWIPQELTKWTLAGPDLSTGFFDA